MITYNDNNNAQHFLFFFQWICSVWAVFVSQKSNKPAISSIVRLIDSAFINYWIYGIGLKRLLGFFAFQQTKPLMMLYDSD